MKTSYHQQLGEAVGAEHHAAGFFASIISGMLLGLGGDALFETEPLLVVIGIVAGSIIGFWRMWQVANHDG